MYAISPCYTVYDVRYQSLLYCMRCTLSVLVILYAMYALSPCYTVCDVRYQSLLYCMRCTLSVLVILYAMYALSPCYIRFMLEKLTLYFTYTSRLFA
jgi:predicted Fe-S protein YdhL (DUF1289 family)